MKKQKKSKAKRLKNQKEQGMALITAIMSLTLCMSLGLAVLFNSVGEAALSGGFSRNEQAFYAADAGIGITRQALRESLDDALQTAAANLPTTVSYATRTVSGLSILTYDRTPIANVLQSSAVISSSGTAITNAKSAVAARSSALTNAGFSVNITLSLLSVSDTSPVDLQQVVTNGSGVNVVQDKADVVAPVTGRYSYTITSTGNNNLGSDNPTRATATAVENGVIDVTLNVEFVTSTTSGSYSRSFSEYGTFINRQGSGVLASGTFGGRVHSNQGWQFSSSNSVTFMGDVTQVNNQYQYDSNMYNVSKTNRTGLTFNSTFTKVANQPLPQNVYKQQLAVLNSSGLADTTYPSIDPTDPTAPPPISTSQLQSALKTAANGTPSTSGGSLNTGVYVPASNVSGTPTINGGGIYVQGTVDEMTLTYSGNAQVYTIKQGSTTTTVTITPPASGSAGSTVVSNGSSSTTFSGVPLDKTLNDPTQYKPATLLYVNGSISKLHGPAASGGTVGAAISKNTALTITATQDIIVTGNLTYQEPTVDASGNAVSYSNNYTPTNVLGLFTNSGKIQWAPNATYTKSNANMTVDAAMVAFNEAALSADSSLATGGWESNCAICTSSTKITLRGSRTVSKLLTILNYQGERYNRYFDPRFANGQMAPPFFPVTSIQNTGSTTTRTATTYTNQVFTESNTWQRTYS